MKFKLKNLGYLREADIELGELTIICGENNTGKTFVNYAIYGFLQTWDSNIKFEIGDKAVETLLQDGIVKIDLALQETSFFAAFSESSKSYSKFLTNIFSAEEDFFKNTSVTIMLDNYRPNYERAVSSELSTAKKKKVLKLFKEKNSSVLEITLLVEDKELVPPKSIIKDFINTGLASSYAGDYFADPFIITSERTGISLFYRELDISKNVMLEHLQSKKRLKPTDYFDIINDSLARYAFPIKDEIDFVRDLPDIYKKRKSWLIKKNPDILDIFKDIVGGEYVIEKNSIFFTFGQEGDFHKIPLHLSSSTVKSLLDANFYIQHVAKKGDILIMDEPELNLHPANQRRMARLFSRLVKSGIKVLITTHSDYLIKELNNLILLSNDIVNKDELMKKYNYTNDDILDKEKVKVYISNNNTLIPAQITNLGIEVGSFDKEIINMNNFFNEVTTELDIAYVG
jgi:ABC-type lipopolysaccharide export system ATPase subunit